MRLYLPKLIVSLLLVIWSVGESYAQLVGNDYCMSALTQYNSGVENDTLYFYLAENSGSLTATPEGGVPGWTFNWQIYDEQNAGWDPFTVETDQPNSTLTGLAAGGYRVTITDANNTVVGCNAAWIIEVLSWPEVTVDILPVGCEQINLIGNITPGSGTPYYDAPADPMVIDANSEITVCFDAVHTFVSDLAFYLVGPPSCGSPVVTLAESPGVCNGGSNINQLCFDTDSPTNFDVCTANTPLNGSYGSYSDANIPIDWSPLYGCDATSPGWAVQIYDCVGLDVGALTGAQIEIDGFTTCGEPLTALYETPDGFSSPINDNSCDPISASIFTVPIPETEENDPFNCGFLWTADPYIMIPDSTTSLNIIMDAPDVTTDFTLSYFCEPGDSAQISGCGMGNMSATATYVPPSDIFVEEPGDVCQDEALQLNAPVGNGVWTGDNVDEFGFVDTSVPGSYTATYSVNDPCVPPQSVSFEVIPAEEEFLMQEFTGICEDAEPILVEECEVGADCNITNNPAIYESGGEVFFDPALAGPGFSSYESQLFTNECSAEFFSASFEVIALDELSFDDPGVICSEAGQVQLEASPANGEWQGSDAVDLSGLFDPTLANEGLNALSYTSNGDCPNTAEFEVEVQSNPVVDLGSDTSLCEGDTLLLSVDDVYDEIFWNDIPQGPELSVTETGEYEVRVINNTCEGSDVIDVTFILFPIIDLGPDQDLCEGESIILSAPFEGEWSTAELDESIEVNSSGTYSYTFPNQGCPVSDSVSVEVFPNLNPVIEELPPLCEDDPQQVLVADIDGGTWSGNGIIDPLVGVFSPGEAQEGINTITYSLDELCASDATVDIEIISYPNLEMIDEVNICEGDTVEIFSALAGDWSNGMTNTDTIMVTVEGSYTLTVNNNNCPISDSTFVNVLAYPIIEIPDSIQLCAGESVEISSNIEVFWSTGDLDTLITVSDPGLYTASQINDFCETTASVRVIENPQPIAELGPDIEGCEGEVFQLNAFNEVNDDYLWSNGVDSMANIIVTESGIYEVITFNPCGTATDQVEVFLDDCSPFIFIPNSFTPNDDGINDFWLPIVDNLRKYELLIYNRFGEVVFESKDPSQPWLGTHKNGDYLVQPGVYPYILRYTSILGEADEILGHVNVIR